MEAVLSRATVSPERDLLLRTLYRLLPAIGRRSATHEAAERVAKGAGASESDIIADVNHLKA